MIKGQDVECIDDSFEQTFKSICKRLPKKGKIYTIRDIVIIYMDQNNAVPAVLLKGIRNKPIELINFIGEPAFGMHRFKAVNDNEEPIDYDRRR